MSTKQSPKISKDLSENQKRIEEVLSACADLKIFSWQYGPGFTHTAFSVYFETLVQDKT